MRQLFEELYQILEAGKSAVLVTVIASSGSTPRGAGSRMLVREDGEIRGTIGGGAVEYRATEIAMEVIKKKISRIKGFTLTKNQVSDIGMICGGEVTVYFQYINPKDEEFKNVCKAVMEALKRKEDSWLVLDLSDEICWRMWLCNSKEEKKALSEKNYYMESLTQAGIVYVFGGGHVAQELVPVLSHVGFRCVVMDDREQFANDRVFPKAERTVVGDMNRISDYLTIKKEDYVCVMTRGHVFDYLVQRQVMACHPRYIGVIGSRSKIGVVTEKLMADGFSREEIDACHMPIGISIRAETPAEIAISIAGELIRVRAG